MYIRFFYGGDPEDPQDSAEQIRQSAELPDKNPLIAILEAPKKCQYIFEGRITLKNVTDFFKGYQAGTLIKKVLKI